MNIIHASPERSVIPKSRAFTSGTRDLAWSIKQTVPWRSARDPSARWRKRERSGWRKDRYGSKGGRGVGCGPV